MDSMHQHPHQHSSSAFSTFSSHPTNTNSPSSYPMYHSTTSTPNVTYIQQSQRMQHTHVPSANFYHSQQHTQHSQPHPMHINSSQSHYSPKYTPGNPHSFPSNHFSSDEVKNTMSISNTGSIPNSPQISPSTRPVNNASIRSPKFKPQASPSMPPSSANSEEKGDDRQRCCVVCFRNSPKSIFSCRYKVHDKNVEALNKYFERELKFGELCDRCYRLWYKYKRNASGSTSNTPNFSPMVPPSGTPPFSPLPSPNSPKMMRQMQQHKNLPLSPLVLQQQQNMSFGASPLSLVPNSPASSSSKPFTAHIMPPPFSLVGNAELSRDEKEIVHQVVNQHYQINSTDKKYYMNGMEHDISKVHRQIDMEKLAASPEDTDTTTIKSQPINTEEEYSNGTSMASSSSQDDLETEHSTNSSPRSTPSPKPRTFLSQLVELSKPPRISKRKPRAIRSVAKTDPVTEFVKFGHYTATHNSTSIPLQNLYKNASRTLHV